MGPVWIAFVWNTAFFSDKEVSDETLAPAPVDPLREVLAELRAAANPILVLGHHPIRWFLRDSAHHFRTLLIEHNAVYLHGHLHEIDPLFGQKGLVSLGFGAGYVAPLSTENQPYYRNTFAICDLDDALTIRFVSWDADYGSWVPETRLPADMHAARSTEPGCCVVRLPTTSWVASPPSSAAGRHELVSAISIKPRLNPPLWLDADAKTGWLTLLEQLGELKGVDKVVTIDHQDANGASVQFVVTDARGRHLVRAFSAITSTITYAQIEQTNTLLDTESLASCILATCGTLAQDAETLAARLRDKKGLSVLTGADLAERATQLSVVDHVRRNQSFSLEALRLTPLISAQGIAVLVVEAAKDSWFCVVAPDGSIVDESADLTYATRKAVPELQDTPYWHGSSTAAHKHVAEATFDRAAYLNRSLSIFDTVRYAGLAALGLRLPIDSLRQLYIPAAADVTANHSSHQALRTAVDDFVEALNLDAAQRDQLEMQLRNYYGVNKTAEAGAAAGLYQKYGAILVVGDPGSGKSCFVRNEILSYSQPPDLDGDWYVKHTPIFLPLADAARIAEQGENLLDICVRFAATQRLDLTRRQLDLLIARGEAAFFFDGVDEVGSLEVRQRLLAQISELIDRYQQQGNRFVVTSRPAAVNTSEVPDELVRIQLRGLTNTEIETLATRIMSIDPTTGEMLPDLRPAAREIVTQLVRDCEEKPGIRRLARNPLLLTLLVLIYSNSGALAARRHIVYSQAIRTLVSVRHRLSKSHVLSEADLRQRLGALALAVYRGIVSEIPSRKEVREVLGPTSGHASAREREVEVDSFLQEVAETTGLVVVHPRSESVEDDVVSFMHHSFLEYYAAVGFMREPNYAERAPLVALSPRWKEVITLMFGLLGEQGDISNFLSEIAKEREPADRITTSRLIMALDCALECDVPPRKAQALIADMLARLLADGPGSVVADARAVVAPKVQELVQNTGSLSIRSKLISGVQSADPRIAAASIDLIARMPQVLSDDAKMREAVSTAFESEHALVRIACIAALQSSPILRTPQNLAKVDSCLRRGTVPEQHAALQLLDSEPALIPQFVSGVSDCLSSKNALVANLAARCVIVGGIYTRENYENRGLLDRALRIYSQADTPQKGLDKYIDLSTEKLEALIYSPAVEDQRFGIRSLVAVRREPAAIHGYLFSVLKVSKDHSVRTTCLEAMAVDPRMLRVASLADAELVCKYTRDEYVDVRRSAARALRHFPGINFVKDTLRDRYEELRDEGDDTERREVVRALAAHGVTDKTIRAFLHDELGRVIGREGGGWRARRKSLIIQLLLACEQMSAVLSPRTSALLYDMAVDFRTPSDVRRLGIRVFGRTCSASVEHGERILTLLDRQARPERLSAYKAAGAFVDRSKGSVATVRAIRPALEKLRTKLIDKWDNESRGVRDRIDFAGLRDIRAALISIEEILASYDEFASRVRAADFDRQDIIGHPSD